jgi:hypothetical protein
MRIDEPIMIQNVIIPILSTDPASLSSPGLIWYNSTTGSIKYTYNVTGSPGVYCVKSVTLF